MGRLLFAVVITLLLKDYMYLNDMFPLTHARTKILHVPVYFKTAVGSVEIVPEKLQFEPAFPVSLPLN